MSSPNVYAPNSYLSIAIGFFLFLQTFSCSASVMARPQQRNMGFINRRGEWVIQPQFWSCDNFYDGVAAVKSADGLYGFIRRDGTYQLKPQFRKAGAFNHGIAPVCISIIATKKSEQRPFNHYQISERWIFIDKSGARVFPKEFAAASCFREGIAIVQPAGADKNQWESIDTNGSVLFRLKNVQIKSFSNGKAAFYDERNRKWGFVNRAGMQVIAPKFRWVSDFSSNGFALVSMEEKKFFFIDSTGKNVFRKSFAEGTMFVNGFAQVRIDNSSKWSLIDTHGRIIKRDWADYADFRGSEMIKKCELVGGTSSPDDLRSRCGFVDRLGQYVVQPKFEYLREFSEGLAAAEAQQPN